jgi:hypothetical protein
MRKAVQTLSISITRNKLIAVEGVDDVCFFASLLRHVGIRGCQIIEMRGKYPLTDKINAVVKTSGFNKVVSFGVAIDADSNYSGTFQSMCAALRHSKLPIPTAPLIKAEGNPQVTVVILPKANTKGMLEDLLLESVINDPAMSCVDAYFQCLKGKGIKPKHISKAKIHAFLSSRKKPELDCGKASKANYWNYNEPVFNEVKNFLALL